MTRTPAAQDAYAEARRLSDDDLAEGIEALGTYYSETLAQHRNETALYGDSWPGAQVQLRQALTHLDAYEAEYARRLAARPVYGPPVPPALHHEEPF